MSSIDQALHNTCSVAACISQTLPFVYKSEKKLFLVLSSCGILLVKHISERERGGKLLPVSSRFIETGGPAIVCEGGA